MTVYFKSGFPGGSVVKNSPASEGDAGDMDLIPELGRCPRVGNGSPLQYSCLKKPQRSLVGLQSMGSQSRT